MGRFTFHCPVTGEIITLSNVAPGVNPSPRYGARATAEEIDRYEEAEQEWADRFGTKWEPTFLRHPHQQHPPEHT